MALQERVGDDTLLDDLLNQAPICEALPDGKKCTDAAEFAAVLESHGCRRDGVVLLLCHNCTFAFSYGAQCAVCDVAPLYIASKRKI